MSGEERQTPWEHGATIAKAIKSVDIEGLTGPIRYTFLKHFFNSNKSFIQIILIINFLIAHYYGVES